MSGFFSTDPMDLTGTAPEVLASAKPCTPKKLGSKPSAKPCTPRAKAPKYVQRPGQGDLIADGYTVLDVTSAVSSFKLVDYLIGMLEYEDPSAQRVIGGFGAYGNPSSAHHPEIRGLRSRVYNIAAPLFHARFPGQYLSMVHDRFCERAEGTSLAKDVFHQDATQSNPNNTACGGWVNLDKVSQWFLCCPGTHGVLVHPDAGFTTLSPEQLAYYSTIAVLVEVPPGHLLIFNELLVHAVRASTRKKGDGSSFRMYTKWFISPDNATIFPEAQIQQMLDSQGVPQLNLSDKYFPMYAKLHAVCFGKTLLPAFSANIRAEFRETSGKHQGRVMRHMPSLLQAGVGMFPDYTPEETAIHFPRRVVVV